MRVGEPLLIYLFNKGQTPVMSNSRILLLESGDKTPPTITPTQHYSNRVCALSLGTVQFLKSKESRSRTESEIMGLRCRLWGVARHYVCKG